MTWYGNDSPGGSVESDGSGCYEQHDLQTTSSNSEAANTVTAWLSQILDVLGQGQTIDGSNQTAQILMEMEPGELLDSIMKTLEEDDAAKQSPPSEWTTDLPAYVPMSSLGGDGASISAIDENLRQFQKLQNLGKEISLVGSSIQMKKEQIGSLSPMTSLSPMLMTSQNSSQIMTSSNNF